MIVSPPDQRSEANPAALLAGTPYQFVRVIGSGGMGVVLEASQPELGRTVVLKLVRTEYSAIPSWTERMRTEALALARLSHPNVVTVIDFGRNELGMPYLVMERLVGETLRDRLQRGALAVQDALGLMLQCLAGLGAAHEAGLLHRDLKPENIFLCERPAGLVKLLDFGLVKPLEPSAGSGPNTSAGVVLGTPRYMSPEQVTASVLTPATDFYSLGLILWEMLVGEHPWSHYQDIPDLYRAHLSELPPAPSQRAPQAVPQDLDRVVLWALAKRPNDRPESCAQFSRVLEQLRQGLPLTEGLANATQPARKPVLESGVYEAEPRTLRLPDKSTEPASAQSQPSGDSSQPRAEPETSDQVTRTVVVLCQVLPGIDLVYRALSLLRSLVVLARPYSVILDNPEKLTQEQRRTIELVSQWIGPIEMVRHAMLGAFSLWLFRLGRRAAAKEPGAAQNLRVWAYAAFGALAASLVLELLALPLHGAFASTVPALEKVPRGVEILKAGLLGYALISTLVLAAFPLGLLWKVKGKR